MSKENKSLIIVKRPKKGGHGHHGAAWKIAYADFVTAMMAFFLLMWLLGSTSKGDLAQIADYFNTPLKIALHQAGTAFGNEKQLVQGGGKDITRRYGIEQYGTQVKKSKKINLDTAKKEIKEQEQQQLNKIKEEIEQMIAADPSLIQFKNQLQIDITEEGLRIQLIDEQNRPMFDSGQSDLKPYAGAILSSLAKVLNKLNNKIAISGHTDASRFGPAYGKGNWELSSDRANACRREMVASGLDDSKIVRVIGMADTMLQTPADPLSPSNRRISILVLNKSAEQKIKESEY